MPLSRKNTRTFHRLLYSGWNRTVTLLKRGNDQKQGTVTSHQIFNVRKSRITKSGEPIQIEVSSSHSTVWHLPLIELQRVGVSFINSADRIVDYTEDALGDWWEPESTTDITVKLDGNHVCLQCVRIDPPRAE